MASSSGSRVSSEHDTEPARLSALYQYHNAPEVAPAHGLEHDDTIYPVSDKFPVLHERKFGPNGSHYTGKHAYSANDNKPPRIIFGMKVKTFLVVATVMVLVVVGAAVGGAVGGKNLHQGTPPPGTYNDMSGTNPSSSTAASSQSTSTSTSSPTAASTYSASTPTYTPLTGCLPSMDNTTYTSSYAPSDSTPPVSGLTFTMHCDSQSPLSSQSGSTQLAAAFVYSFADCVEVCAGVNWQNAAVDCTVAVYQPGGQRPANCWVGTTSNSSTEASLRQEDGTEVALLVQ